LKQYFDDSITFGLPVVPEVYMIVAKSLIAHCFFDPQLRFDFQYQHLELVSRSSFTAFNFVERIDFTFGILSRIKFIFLKISASDTKQ
jgi:hypothetical protein